MLLKILLWSIVLYYLYKFIFGVVVPVGKATNQMKSKIKEMQDEQLKQQQTSAANTTSPNQTSKPNFNSSAVDGDYIEFEEVK